MVTIKEIAKASGFSPSTVSIVLSGKSDERKISEKTKQKILYTANKLGYRVNVTARRLRVSHTPKTMISVFMTMDQRAYMMTRFLLGLYKAAEEWAQPFEIVVHFYKNGSLHQFIDNIELTNCAIICNTSEEDQRYLEGLRLSVPIVLYYRTSEKYCTVSVNMSDIGEMAAEILARRGRKSAVLLDTDEYFRGMKECTQQFAERAKHLGMSVSYIRESHDVKGGYNGGTAISEINPAPDCVFCMSSAMAVGLLRAFDRQGIKIPEQLELISMGTSTTDLEEHASVPLSTIHLPVEEMAKECLRLLIMQLDGKIDTPQSVEAKASYMARESCGE